ncbi:MAG: hypothetical protein ACQXXF_07165, partial [Thermoplasmatota archaeon]
MVKIVKKTIDRSFVTNFLFPSLIVLCILFLCVVGVYGSFFYSDWRIIFEGSYRIFKGQVPYRDFFMPVGPVVFYFQAFFDFLFSPNLLAMAMHSF